jgi:hypothetical protein
MIALGVGLCAGMGALLRARTVCRHWRANQNFCKRQRLIFELPAWDELIETRRNASAVEFKLGLISLKKAQIERFLMRL